MPITMVFAVDTDKNNKLNLSILGIRLLASGGKKGTGFRLDCRVFGVKGKTAKSNLYHIFHSDYPLTSFVLSEKPERKEGEDVRDGIQTMVCDKQFIRIIEKYCLIDCLNEKKNERITCTGHNYDFDDFSVNIGVLHINTRISNLCLAEVTYKRDVFGSTDLIREFWRGIIEGVGKEDIDFPPFASDSLTNISVYDRPFIILQYFHHFHQYIYVNK
ncbi:hypothetical protein SNEBB_010754 [Seison nebaliae]|nr:hypothetical protein SNEBB_010754 [Seison nebaliae]